MRRAFLTGCSVAAAALIFAACSGSSAAKPFGAAPACPELAQLARTGEAVAHTAVADPAAFDAALNNAVSRYVHVAERLRASVPVRLRPDVDRMIAAARRRRFSDAEAARSQIDDYAQAVCKST